MGERKIRGEAMQVRTPGGVVEVRWDERGTATAMGQRAFFAELSGGHGFVRRLASNMPAEVQQPERAGAGGCAGHMDAVDPGRALPLRACGRTAR